VQFIPCFGDIPLPPPKPIVQRSRHRFASDKSGSHHSFPPHCCRILTPNLTHAPEDDEAKGQHDEKGEGQSHDKRIHLAFLTTPRCPPPSAFARLLFAIMARVYADVNQSMPRSYWDYDSVNISECDAGSRRLLRWAASDEPGIQVLCSHDHRC
jgi:hypothetical protein